MSYTTKEPQFGLLPRMVERSLTPRVTSMLGALREAKHRLDTWANPVTGFGTSRDKTTYGQILPSRLLSDEELSAIYHHDDMGARMVDVVPQEMFREGFSVETGDPEVDTIIADKHEEIGTRQHFAEGFRWARAFGGAGVLIGADDGREAIEPLRIEKCRDIDYLYPIDRRLLWPVSYYTEPGPKMGEPKTFLVTTIGGYTYNTSEVHESRLILFQGAATGRREKLQFRGWNMSVYQRAYEILRQFNSGWTSVETMLVDGNQAIFKMGGLSEILRAGGETELQTRLRTMDMFRSVIRAIVVDADAKEEFERQSVSFEQIPQVLEKFMLRLSATVETPVTILMGQSPAGMNATGESDFRWFYDRMRSKQNQEGSPRVRHLTDLWLRTKRGRELVKKRPEVLTVKWPPLWTETPLVAAQRRLAIAQGDAVYIQSQAVMPEEVTLSRFRPEGFQEELQITPEATEYRKALVASRSIEDETDTDETGTPIADGEGGDPIEGANGAPKPAGANTEGDPEMPSGGAGAPTADKPIELKLTPTDIALITKVNEARASNGLPPLPEPDGSMFLPAFKAKYAETIAVGTMAGEGIDPDAPKPAGPPGGFGGGPPGGKPPFPPRGGGEDAPKDGEAPKGGDSFPDAKEAGKAAAAAFGGKDEEERADGHPFRTAGKRLDHPEERTDGRWGRTLAETVALVGATVDAKTRTFKLHRDIDESGVSGTGIVAEGCLFGDGKVAMRWTTTTASTTLFDSLEHVLKVHGHAGKTRLVFDDEE